MDQNLGNLIRTVHAPEKLSTPKPLGQAILVNFLTVFLPMLLVGATSGTLLKAAGVDAWVAWVVCLFFTLVMTALLVWLTGQWTKRYAEETLEIRSNGVCGVAPANAFKSRQFALSYGELQNAVGKKNRLSLIGANTRVNLITDNAESLAAELLQHAGK